MVWAAFESEIRINAKKRPYGDSQLTLSPYEEMLTLYLYFFQKYKWGRDAVDDEYLYFLLDIYLLDQKISSPDGEQIASPYIDDLF